MRILCSLGCCFRFQGLGLGTWGLSFRAERVLSHLPCFSACLLPREVHVRYIEYGVYGDLIIIYTKPYSIYLSGTIIYY